MGGFQITCRAVWYTPRMSDRKKLLNVIKWKLVGIIVYTSSFMVFMIMIDVCIEGTKPVRPGNYSIKYNFSKNILR